LILEANLRGAQLLGVGRNRLVKQRLIRYIVPKDHDIYYLHHKRLLETGVRQVCELRMCRQDGSRFWARLETGTARDGENGPIVSRTTVSDITEQKRAEALQSAIFNSANFSSIATDAKGVIQTFNVGAERMLGYTAAEVVNKMTPADITDPQELTARARSLSVELGTTIPPGFEALVSKASRGIEDTFELTYIRKNGSRSPAVVSFTALRDAQDVITGYLLIGTDNTARKRVE
jgi:PAS domain S-box-containing protein